MLSRWMLSPLRLSIGALLALATTAGCATTSAPAAKCRPAATADKAEPTPTSRPLAALPPTDGFKPLDARLTDYPYPFPTQTLTVRYGDRPLELVYMDVKPAQPTGEVVVLLHGKNFSGAYWEDTIRALTARGARVVVPDQIGFGKSSKPTDIQYSFHQLARWTADLLDHLKIKQASVVGHSMGGMLATRFALIYPARTTRLALVNPIGLEDWRRLTPYRTVDRWTRANLASTPGKIRRYMQESYFDGKWKPEWDSLVTIQAGWSLSAERQQLARVSALTYEMIYTQPVLYELPDLKAPTLLIIGTRDRTALGKPDVPPEQRARLGRYDQLGKAAAKAIPNATLIELPNIGHVPQVEAKDQTLKALGDFLTPAK